MNLFPAIDLYTGWAVRLYQGDYNQMTVYDKDPLSVAKRFRDAGAEYLHMVDLEGAKTGETPNLDTVRAVAAQSGLQVEIGGGIRSEEVIKQYLDAGVLRVILGTAAITQPGFVGEMVAKYGDKIAVGVDVRDGFVAIKGWTEISDRTCFDFCRDMDGLGVKTIICTDISKDGVLGGTNLELYKQLSETLTLDIVASGGVSSLDDIAALQKMGLYGAILGKAVYTGAIDLAKAVALTKGAAV